MARSKSVILPAVIPVRHPDKTELAAAVRACEEILRDWDGALDALIAHGAEEAVPRGVSSAPLDFEGIGNFPLLKLLELYGTAPVEVLSAEIFDAAAAELMPSAARLRWAEWTAKHGDPVHVFLRLAEELGVVTVDGVTVALTPLGTWAMIEQLDGARTEQLPPSAELTGQQVIICCLGMSDEAFERELEGWLAARTPDSAVRELLTTADGEDPAYLTAGVRTAASIPGDTEAAWRAATELLSVRPYVIAELNRRAGRDLRRDPLPGLEPFDCDAVVMASNAIIAAYATGRRPEALAEAVRQAAIPTSRDVLFEDMWRSRHAIAEQALSVVGEHHPDKKIAKAARTALRKAMSARPAPRPR
jgi:hypothetical protein